MKKQVHDIRDLIYIHHNNLDQYVISYGIEFKEFISSCSTNLNYLLLLKHQFNDAEFNMHTLLEYVPKDKIAKLTNEGVYSYGNFCWLDFAEVEGLNELNGQEIAELLYLGHLKQHLKQPFYQKLSNKFAYLAHDDGWFNKIYYKDLGNFYEMLGGVIGLKLSENHTKRTIFNLRKSRTFPSVPGKTLTQVSNFIREGMVISLKNKEESRQRVEIPIWVLGDFLDMDDMYEEAMQVEKDACHAKLVFEKKTNEWKLLL